MPAPQAGLPGPYGGCAARRDIPVIFSKSMIWPVRPTPLSPHREKQGPHPKRIMKELFHEPGSFLRDPLKRSMGQDGTYWTLTCPGLPSILLDGGCVPAGSMLMKENGGLDSQLAL